MLVSAEAVPYRPNRGVYVVVRDRTVPGNGVPSSTRTSRPAPDDDDQLAGALLGADGVAGVWTFATDTRFDRYDWRPGNRTITVCYLDAAPLSVTPGLSDLVRAATVGKGRAVVFAGPFETITPWRWDWFDDET